MYTTTQLLIFLAALAGNSAVTPTSPQGRHESVPAAAVSVEASINDTPLYPVTDRAQKRAPHRGFNGVEPTIFDSMKSEKAQPLPE